MIWEGERMRRIKRGRTRCGRRQGRSTEGQKIDLFEAVEDGELGLATRKSQMPGNQEVPRTQQQ